MGNDTTNNNDYPFNLLLPKKDFHLHLNEEQQGYDYRDPVNAFGSENMHSSRLKRQRQHALLQSDPKIYQRSLHKMRYLTKFFCLLIFTWIIIDRYTTGPSEYYVLMILLIIIPLGIEMRIKDWYYGIYQDIIKLYIAKEKNRFFDPSSSDKLRKLGKKFPELFSISDDKQYISNQFRGTYGINQQHFHMGEIYGGNKSKYISYHYVCLNLPRTIDIKLLIYPKESKYQFNHKSFQEFWSMEQKEINVESNTFNKYFSFSYIWYSEVMEKRIIKILSPVVQEKILSLYETTTPFSVLFSGSCLTFMFEGPILKHVHSLDYNDIEKISQTFTEKLDKILNITTEITTYLS